MNRDWFRMDWYDQLQAATFESPPLYCTSCGSLLRRVEHREGWTGDGRRKIVPGYKCPKGLGLFSLITGRGMRHDDLRAEVFGDRGYWSQVTYR